MIDQKITGQPNLKDILNAASVGWTDLTAKVKGYQGLIPEAEEALSILANANLGLARLLANLSREDSIITNAESLSDHLGKLKDLGPGPTDELVALVRRYLKSEEPRAFSIKDINASATQFRENRGEKHLWWGSTPDRFKKLKDLGMVVEIPGIDNRCEKQYIPTELAVSCYRRGLFGKRYEVEKKFRIDEAPLTNGAED